MPSHYSHRDKAVFQLLRDGMFMVQLEGETRLVPLGVLHCTFTVMPSLLVGSQFSFHNGFWLDRQLVSFRSELAADINATDRCTPHVSLSRAIVQGMENSVPSEETVQCWLKSEAELRAAFDACPEHWQCMRGAWRPYVKGKDCLFCTELPTNNYHLLMDEEHLSRHVPSLRNTDLPNSTSGSHWTGLQPDPWSERQRSFQEDLNSDPDYIEPSASGRSWSRRKRKPGVDRGAIREERGAKKRSLGRT